MLNKILSYLMIGGLTIVGIGENAIAQPIRLESIQDPELSLSSVNKDVFTTSIPATLNLTLEVNPNLANNPDILIPVTVRITEPFLSPGETPDPSGTKRTAFVSFTDSSGRKTFNSDTGSIQASLRPGTTEFTVTIETDRPVEYFGGSYSYNTTLTVDVQ